MAVLLNIPHGLTHTQLKTMQSKVNKVITNQDNIQVKTVSFMFDNTLQYVYEDDSIVETSIVTVSLEDESQAMTHGIDYTINVKNGNIIFTCESIPYDDCAIACNINAIVKIVNL